MELDRPSLTRLTLVQVFHLFCTRPIFEPLLTYVNWTGTILNRNTNETILSWKCISKSRLQNSSPALAASEAVVWWLSLSPLRSNQFPGIETHARLLHSPSLVAVGLSAGYGTWPPISWHHAFVIGWSKYGLGLPSAPLYHGLTWPVGIPTVFQT